jgi:hypothetical protein
MQTKIFRQGDVLIERIDSIPKKAKEIKRKGRLVLAEGEATGHAHVIKDRLARLFGDDDGNRYVSLEQDAVLEHEEHAPHRLEAGNYKVTRQREYSPEAIRNVAD